MPIGEKQNTLSSWHEKHIICKYLETSRLTEKILFCRQPLLSSILIFSLHHLSSVLFCFLFSILRSSFLFCFLFSSFLFSHLYSLFLICLIFLFSIFWSMPILITPSTLLHYIDAPRTEAPFDKSLSLPFLNIAFLVESISRSLPNNTLK